MTGQEPPRSLGAFVLGLAAVTLAGAGPGDDESAGFEVEAPVKAITAQEPDPAACLVAVAALRRAGPHATPAAPALAALVRRADGRTPAWQVAGCLEVLQAIGPGASAVAGDLAGVLPERSRLYRDRPHLEVARLRSFLLATLAEVGVPDAALPAVVDHLVNEPMAQAFGAGARAAGSRGGRSSDLVPWIVTALRPGFHDEPFSLRTFDPDYPPAEATCARAEALRALARIGPAARSARPDVERFARRQAERGDPDCLLPIAREALLILGGGPPRSDTPPDDRSPAP